MKREDYTLKQLLAIDTRDRSLLVSAAAGSGKTQVLTQRIIDSLIAKEMSITDMLIVTFTKTAAADMRRKITEALSEALAQSPGNEHLAKQLMLIGGAPISTIDAFFLDLVRTHFEEAGFSPSLRVADEGELLSERRDVMNSVIDRFYNNPAFVTVSNALCELRSEEKLTEILLDLYEKLSTYPDFCGRLLKMEKSLRDHAAAPLDSPSGETFFEQCRALCDAGREICARYKQLLDGEEQKVKLGKIFAPAYDDIHDRLEQLHTALEAKDIGGVFAALSLTNKSKIQGGTRPAMSEDFYISSESLKVIREKFFTLSNQYGFFSPEEVERSAHRSADILEQLYLVLEDFRLEYGKLKTAREMCDFCDVTHAAYRLLINKENGIAQNLSERFGAVYIDEYQDVNPLQDAAFCAIATPKNRFMVGDIKQSIYRFRGAQPALFTSYRRSFPVLEPKPTEDGKVLPLREGDCGQIIMSECFRCDKPVIDLTNTVFRFLFSRHSERIGYTAADDMNFSKKDKRRSPDHVSPPCQVICIKKSKGSAEEEDEETSAVTAEAMAVVGEIERLIKEEKRPDGSPVTPSDIAILVRKGKQALPFIAALQQRGIPINDTSRKNLFANPEVLCVYSLLAVIDNPLRDIYLAATLRSPFFGFTLAELVRIRGSVEEQMSLYEAVELYASMPCAEGQTLPLRCAEFLKRLARWQDHAEHMGVDKLLRELYRETALLSFAGNTESERSNLERLLESARKFEASGFKGLYSFIRYVDELMKNDLKNDEPGGEADGVKIITVHHSKGLEYPICFLVGTHAAFSTRDIRHPLLLEEHLGCAMLLPDVGALSRSNTFWRATIADELSALSREEEMRILYVAMTRAEERLYISGSMSDADGKKHKAISCRAKPEAVYFSTDANCWLHWILTAIEADGFPSHVTVTEREEQEVVAAWRETDDSADASAEPTAKQTSSGATSAEAEEAVPSPAQMTADLIEERLMAKYQFEALTKLPAKLSVSKLSPTVLDVFDTDAAPVPEKPNEEDIGKLLDRFDRPFLGESTTERQEETKKNTDAAERGTATHEFLQFCDFKSASRSVTDECMRLMEKGFLPRDAEDKISFEELEQFFKSPLYARIPTEDERRLFRERRFNLFFRAAEHTQSDERREALNDEELLVQGVIDLCFIDDDGKLVLVDYKTDRLTAYELEHGAAAAKKLFDRHRRQLGYYKTAITELFERVPDEVLLYSLHAGCAFSDPEGKL